MSATRVEARDVEVRLHELKQKGAIDVEFERLNQETGKLKYATEAAVATYNVRKNRYGNVLPLDDTRVLLQPTGQLGREQRLGRLTRRCHRLRGHGLR